MRGYCSLASADVADRKDFAVVALGPISSIVVDYDNNEWMVQFVSDQEAVCKRQEAFEATVNESVPLQNDSSLDDVVKRVFADHSASSQ